MQGLQEKEGIARCRCHDQAQFFLAQGMAEDCRGELGRALHRQIPQFQDLGVPGGPRALQPPGELAVFELFIACRSDHEQWRRAGECHENGQPGHRGLVTPLQVIDGQQERTVHGKECPRQALEEP